MDPQAPVDHAEAFAALAKVSLILQV